MKRSLDIFHPLLVGVMPGDPSKENRGKSFVPGDRACIRYLVLPLLLEADEGVASYMDISNGLIAKGVLGLGGNVVGVSRCSPLVSFIVLVEGVAAEVGSELSLNVGFFSTVAPFVALDRGGNAASRFDS